MIATSTDHDKAFEIIRDIQLVDLNYRDAQFVRAELSDKIANAITAAVQAEREAQKPLIDALKEIQRTDEDGFVFHTPREIVVIARTAILACGKVTK